MSSSSTSSAPEMMQRRAEDASLANTMNTGPMGDCGGNGNQRTEAALSTTSPSPSPPRTGCFDALAAVLLVQISSFSPESNLSGVCRSTLSAIRKLHYTVNVRSSFSIGHKGHMGLQESGALATGRVVTRITVMVGGQEVNTMGGKAFVQMVNTLILRQKVECGAWDFYKASEEAVKRVVRHSIPTLRRITVSGGKWRQDGRFRVAPIIGELVPLSAKRRRVAPQLRRVELVAGATGVAKAGKAVAAGLWPALEVLKLSRCRANASQFEELAHGIRTGRAPHLRVLNWDDQSCIRKRPVDDVILSALAWGRCPRIESLSFTGNHFCPEHRILYLKDALKACPGLLSLEMDCSRRPCVQLHDLTCALRKGHLPNLVYLFVRATAPYYRGSDVELKALREAAASRGPPVMLLSEIKTRLPPMA